MQVKIEGLEDEVRRIVADILGPTKEPGFGGSDPTKPAPRITTCFFFTAKAER